MTSGLLLLLGVAIGAGLTVSHLHRARALAATAWARFDQATALEESGRILDARRVLDRLEREDRRHAVSALAVAIARWFLLQHGAGAETSILQAHDGHLNAAAFLPDGRRAVSAGDDGAIRISDVRTGLLLRTLQEDDRPVLSIALSADGRLLLSGSFDRTMRRWDLATGRPLRQFVGHGEQVSAVAFSPDGGIALSGGWDGKLMFWSLGVDPLLEPEIGGASGCAVAGLSGSGRDVLTDDGRGGYSAWDLDTRREILHVDQPLKGPGRILRTPRASFGLGTDGGGVMLRELASGRCVWRSAVGLHDVFLVPSPEGGRSIWVQDGRGALHRIDPDGGRDLE